MSDVFSAGQWARLLAGLAGAFGLFHWSASVLGSDRGQSGLQVSAIVVGATLAVERAWFAPTLRSAVRAVGLGAPHPAGLLLSAAVSALLVLVVPVFVWVTASSPSIEPNALRLLPGLFAQGGIAEEILFRGYLFGHLRRGRTFWRAAALSMVPFVTVHLLLFLTMPWPVALAALALSVAASFPFAWLFELGGATIWAPALLHVVVQSTPKLVVFSGEVAGEFPVIWMASSAVASAMVFLVRRPRPA